MATRFAVATGNWSNTAIWDNGALPTSSDTVYPNGFTVTIDQDITIQSLNNNISAVRLPDMSIPAMTGNTQPSGVASASVNLATAWQAFDQNSATAWNTGSNTIGNISYQFTTGKVIKRYYWQSDSTNRIPSAWTFQGSNDGSTWTTIETITGHTLIDYTSGATVAANTTSYTYYRINITTNAVPSNGTLFIRFEMTESVSTSYGTTSGGSFAVPSTLSGIRNIVQSGSGICTPNNNTIINIQATAGATVNFNITSGGFIFNQTLQRTSNSTSPLINITGNCAVNFNANLWGWQTNNVNYITGGNININAAATVTVNGNIYGSKGGTNSSNFDSVIHVTNANGVLNVNGDIYGGSNTAFGQAITSLANNTINVTGNIYGDLSAAIYTSANSNINIVGTVNLINNNSIAAISAYNWTNQINPLITVNGYVVNKNNTMAIAAAKVRFTANTTPYWVFQDTTNTNITLAYGSATGAYPAESDVRFGVTYAASPTRTGTCRVPLPQYVSQGVLVDATVGTAYLDASDVWNVLTSTMTTAGSIGERLKNASTVQTTGDQLASYQV